MLGLITYIIRENAVEIVTVNSLKPSLGVGSALIEKVIEMQLVLE